MESNGSYGLVGDGHFGRALEQGVHGERARSFSNWAFETSLDDNSDKSASVVIWTRPDFWEFVMEGGRELAVQVLQYLQLRVIAQWAREAEILFHLDGLMRKGRTER